MCLAGLTSLLEIGFEALRLLDIGTYLFRTHSHPIGSGFPTQNCETTRLVHRIRKYLLLFGRAVVRRPSVLPYNGLKLGSIMESENAQRTA